MACRIAYRVAGDAGPALTVNHPTFITTGWTITARFEKANGEKYTIAATITQVGDGGSTPALYEFVFAAGNLTVGEQQFEINYTHVSEPNFTLEGKEPLKLVVRSPLT